VDEEMREPRRYTGALIGDDRLNAMDGLLSDLRLQSVERHEVHVPATPGCQLFRVAHEGTVNLYPDRLAVAKGSVFVHYVYVARVDTSQILNRERPTRLPPESVFLIAAPYVYLLSRLMGLLGAKYDDLRFLRPHLPEVVGHFTPNDDGTLKHDERLSVSRVKVLASTTNGTEFVTISGKKPLDSPILAAFAADGDATREVSIKADISKPTRANSTGFNQLGSVWWRISSDASMANVIRTIVELLGFGFMETSLAAPRPPVLDD
jgi:hypothetical protein